MRKGSGEPLKEPCKRLTTGERATGRERWRLAQWIEALRRAYSRGGSEFPHRNEILVATFPLSFREDWSFRKDNSAGSCHWSPLWSIEAVQSITDDHIRS